MIRTFLRLCSPVVLAVAFSTSNFYPIGRNQSPTILSTSQSLPYLGYEIFGGSVIVDPVMPPVLANGQADYATIFARHNVCDLISSGQIQEVWIWAGNGDGLTKGHMWEWTTSGPGWNGDTPNCGKVVTTLAYNYLLDVGFALHSFGHRMEGFAMQYLPCDLSTRTWPWDGQTAWPTRCAGLLSDQYGFVARPSSSLNNNVGGCGDVHHPPNITDNHEYDYSNLQSVQTICTNWSEDGSSSPVSVDCRDWECSQTGFMLWWLQNIPGQGNANRDKHGIPFTNWWSYLFGLPSDHQVFLPLVKASGLSDLRREALVIDAPSSSRQQRDILGSHYATSPNQALQQRAGGNASPQLISASNLTATKAVTVLVLAYPGYGGTPVNSFENLTVNLINYLKQASTYRGYLTTPPLQANFLGQDGKNYAGQGCAAGTTPNNIHIHLAGLKTDVQAISYSVEDPAGGGLWATPCNPVSNWLLSVVSATPGQADLYFSPFRAAPSGTIYTISVQYSDGTIHGTAVVGTQVQP